MVSNRIILSLNFIGECKLVSLSPTDSYSLFKEMVMGKWPVLLNQNLSFVCTIGSISSFSMDCEDDFMNMILLCEHSSTKIVSVKVLSQRSPRVGVDTDHLGCNPVSYVGGSYNGEFNHLEANLNPGAPKQATSRKRFRGCNTASEELGSFNGESIEFDDNLNQCAPKQVTLRGNTLRNNISGQHDEFGGKNSLPCYDVCPIQKKKPLLSDMWADIMKGGVGTIFSGGIKEFRAELIKYSTQMDFKFKYKRNDPRYVHAVCSEAGEGCDWFIKGKRQTVTGFCEIYEGNFIHKCVGKIAIDRAHRLGTPILAGLVLHKVKSKPITSGKDIMHLIQDEYGVEINYHKAWRTVEVARDKIFGSYVESYDQLRWYCKAVERTNPGSVVFLERNPETNRFERLFIAFKACIDGFRRCRPMLFLDGTFMKGRAKGTLLSATAKDGNNGLFPVAFAIVAAENFDNWVWFLQKLREFIKHDKQVFYISDRNCGLMSAFPVVFSDPVHFYCLYHLLTNLKGCFGNGWSSKHRTKMGDHFKQCAYAPNTRIFEEKMKIFKEVGGKKAEQWLKHLPYEKWAVAYSPHIRRYGEMTSNAAESFNSWIREDRGLPITYMIDSIRTKISRWYVERRQLSSKWTGALCSNKQDLWNNLTEIGRSWIVVLSPDGCYQVYSEPSVCVDLAKKSCSCYQWQVKGFPCSHAIAVIRKVGTSIYNHIEECFLAEKYRECYMVDIHPIPETERFECQNTTEEKILPPSLNRQPGRPKKFRQTSFGEYPKKKIKKKFFCEVCCKMSSHDNFTCSFVPEVDVDVGFDQNQTSSFTCSDGTEANFNPGLDQNPNFSFTHSAAPGLNKDTGFDLNKEFSFSCSTDAEEDWNSGFDFNQSSRCSVGTAERGFTCSTAVEENMNSIFH